MEKQHHKVFYINIIVTLNDDEYLARCPGIQGAFSGFHCYTCGDTLMAKLRELR